VVKVQTGCSVLVFSLLCASASAYDRSLSDRQQRAIDRSFPNSKILSICSGNFSGNSPDEMILTLVAASNATEPNAVHRVGLTFSDNKWNVHSIDNELMKDSSLSNSSHVEQWNHPADPEKFAQNVKCNVSLRYDKLFSQNGKPMGRPLFFKAPNSQKGVTANTCFSTVAEYNNWDCVAYDPKQSRFRLWYQQVFAD
jgi:hypothetical protein